MKILFLTHRFYPDIGGIEVNSDILATEFAKQACGFTLFKVGRSISGPALYALPDTARRVSSWEPQNTIATRDVVRLQHRFNDSGWQCLSRRG